MSDFLACSMTISERMAATLVRYQIDGITDEPNNMLSKLDRAFITLNYPPDLTDHKDDNTKKRLSRFNTAMRDAGVQAKSGEILQAFMNPGPVLNKSTEDPPQISDSLEAVRIQFTKLNRTMFLRRRKCVPRAKYLSFTRLHSQREHIKFRECTIKEAIQSFS